MNLDEAQRRKVTAWIAEGLKLSDIQNRLATEFNLRLTYMDVRFLVDDLKLTPKDPEPPKTPPSALTAPGPAASSARGVTPAKADAAVKAKPPGGVSLSVDTLMKPGAVVSGKVTFSDGNTADWYLDQTGRLGLAPQQAGYRPPAADVQQFQAQLEVELSKLGY